MLVCDESELESALIIFVDESQHGCVYMYVDNRQHAYVCVCMLVCMCM